MKMVKKILLGMVATAAIIGFVGCKATVDDPEEAITGSGNDYSVNYDNTSGEGFYRAYHSTDMKHAGALVKVTFDKKDVGSSKMGVIFDLHDNATNGDAKDFYIIGLGTTSTRNFYVSKFTNVTQLREDNFGTKLAENPAKETIIKNLGDVDLKIPSADPDGKVTMYVYFKAFDNGSYEYAVLSLSDTTASNIKINSTSLSTLESSLDASNILTKGTITSAFTGSTIPQNQLAVYAMITPGAHLTGSWKYSMYKEAEEIAE